MLLFTYTEFIDSIELGIKIKNFQSFVIKQLLYSYNNIDYLKYVFKKNFVRVTTIALYFCDSFFSGFFFSFFEKGSNIGQAGLEPRM